MKIGDLVSMRHACGGPPGGLRCDSALVLSKRQTWKSVEVDAYVYKEIEAYDYELLCSCGQFEEDGNYLELIKG